MCSSLYGFSFSSGILLMCWFCVGLFSGFILSCFARKWDMRWWPLWARRRGWEGRLRLLWHPGSGFTRRMRSWLGIIWGGKLVGSPFDFKPLRKSMCTNLSPGSLLVCIGFKDLIFICIIKWNLDSFYINDLLLHGMI